MSLIKCLDISSLQETVDWANVAVSGVEAVYLRCGYGNGTPDSHYLTNVALAIGRGIIIGAYHVVFPLPHLDPALQAKAHYIACGGRGSKPGDLLPMIDCEWPTVNADNSRNTMAYWGCTPKQIRDWHMAYLDAAEKLYGVRPGVYTFPDYANNQVSMSLEPRYALSPFWLAEWTGDTDDDTKWPSAISPWADVAVWQTTGGGARLSNGCPLDTDRIRGEDLASLTRGAHP